MYERCIFTTYFIVNNLHFLSQHVTATLQSCFHPHRPWQLQGTVLAKLSQVGWDGWKLLGSATSHTQGATGTYRSLAKDMSFSLILFKIPKVYMKPTKSSSAYFNPCIKNVLARVKSDNSLKHQSSNNQKLIRENLSAGTGSCEKSWTSSPACISWLLSSWPLADLSLQQISNACCVSPISPITLPSWKFLDLPKLLKESLSISNTLTCYTSPQLACVLRETNTGYGALDPV